MASARILIVYDHPLIGDALQFATHTRHTDMQVDVVNSLAAAEAMCCETQGLKLVLLDYRLPDSTGYS
ncbi:response regulator [Sphingomonas prati]|uniref:DNA-binding response OmpR family regulator n=2 Tax=Sphingomonas prati TaxID=1843237 RepID=A0A7W9BVF4_9SPHN|nr:response regulator [Sphingomonas prati]MBB5730859.1 DNA-binding response OmpR family regulator [Sphingomonas prati]GGE97178.1 hypothetical protein GCM10011404_32890 [Sphingomonas prati]